LVTFLFFVIGGGGFIFFFGAFREVRFKDLFCFVGEVLVVVFKLEGGFEVLAVLCVEFVAVEEDLIDIPLNFAGMLILVSLEPVLDGLEVHGREYGL
jgi:hypothetical protein